MTNDYPYHRFAVSVNRKIGNSVERNYIKRVMKEWFRLDRNLVSGHKSFDMWVVLKKRFDHSNVQEVRQLLMSIIEKINRYK